MRARYGDISVSTSSHIRLTLVVFCSSLDRVRFIPSRASVRSCSRAFSGSWLPPMRRSLSTSRRERGMFWPTHSHHVTSPASPAAMRCLASADRTAMLPYVSTLVGTTRSPAILTAPAPCPGPLLPREHDQAGDVPRRMPVLFDRYRPRMPEAGSPFIRSGIMPGLCHRAAHPRRRHGHAFPVRR